MVSNLPLVFQALMPLLMAPGVASFPETNQEGLVFASPLINALNLNYAETSQQQAPPLESEGAFTLGRDVAVMEQKCEVEAEVVIVRASAACKRQNVLRADGGGKKMEAL